mgnify:CR=1 FL=1
MKHKFKTNTSTTDNLLPPKMVLAFDAVGSLVGMFPSVNKAGELTGISPQSISAVCSGKIASSGGLYFRHLDSNLVTVNSDDLDNLTVRSYDEAMGELRIYSNPQTMIKRRNKLINKNKNKKNESKSSKENK